MEDESLDVEHLGIGVSYVRFKNGASRFVVTDFAGLRAALGDRLLIALCRVMNAASRLLSLVDLAKANTQAHQSSPVKHERNFATAVFLAAGYAVETSDAITELRRADVETGLSQDGLKSWAALQTIETLASRAATKKVRDELAFHLGSPAQYTAGIRKIAGDSTRMPTLMKIGAEGKTVDHASFELGFEILYAGLSMDEETTHSVFSDVLDVQMTLVTHFEALLFEVLISRGLPRPGSTPGE